MNLPQFFLFALFLTSGALSAPTPGQPPLNGRSFRVERVRRGISSLHGPTALRRAYEKFGIVPIDLGIDLSDFEPISKHAASQQDVAEPDQVGAVSAASVQNDAAFVSPVKIGGQEIVMNFDTGSADFWILNSRLPELDTTSRTVYNPSNSSTFKEMEGSTFNISYGDSSYAYGNVGTDIVDIGGATVKDQAIGLPTAVSATFLEDTYSNGLVGLAFSKLNTITPKKQKTFFDNLAPTLDEPVLTASLKSDGMGEYEFGVIDHSKYRGDLANITIDSSKGFWEFPSKAFSVGGGALQEVQKTHRAIADTGTSLMLLDQSVVDAYYKQVHGAVYVKSASGYIYPCAAELPSLTMAVGEKHYATVPGEYIRFSEIGVNKTTGEEVCYGGVQSNQGSSLQIFGDVFLKAFFAVFDLRGPSLGLAPPNF
ncbi:aspartic peptidase domain-containing protein [Aspergillus ambiguus]|uniref:pepsin-like aspartic protease n=1 Tax=Aspergillus ambiguus TaxID=176160 RepID=UPI003CCD296B